MERIGEGHEARMSTKGCHVPRLRFPAKKNKRTVGCVIYKVHKYQNKSVKGIPGMMAQREDSEPCASAAWGTVSFATRRLLHEPRGTHTPCHSKEDVLRWARRCPWQMLQFQDFFSPLESPLSSSQIVQNLPYVGFDH